jgi:RNA polymerase sigma factor (sigma-70 family)
MANLVEISRRRVSTRASGTPDSRDTARGGPSDASRLAAVPGQPRGGDVGDLLARVNDGDESAWNELVDRFAGLVWSVARSFRLSAAATEDVVQTVWLRLAEHSARIREPEHLAGWLATSTRHEALRVIRGHQRMVPYSDFSETSEPTSLSVEDLVTDDVTDDIAIKAVLEAFVRLPAAEQQLLRLLCTEPPLDYKTIAELLGRSIGSIGPSRARSLAKLRKLLPSGIDPRSSP